MDAGCDALTEKEKETLRLMVRGHDAKSMANELSLSVHTINERLRAARRKLDVTSSREAARMLFESEGRTYENSVYEELRDAEAPGSSHDPPISHPVRKRAVLTGAIIMSAVLAAILLAQASAPDAPSNLSEAAVDTTSSTVSLSDAKVEQAARDWLALVDRGDWVASFDATGRSFKRSNTLAGWADAAKQVRGPQGDIVSRALLTVRMVEADPHDLWEVAFATRYESAEVVETITLQDEGSEWKVVGIMVD